MKNIELKKGIYWVGAIDWGLRNFHGYLTQRGSTYNSFLIVDKKITLIDTVKSYLVDELLARISQIVDPSKIDNIISNHVEMDHSGGISRVLEIAKNAKIYTSPNGKKGLINHYKKDWNFEVLKSGDEINIGERTLKTVLTPMVHWPDNMFVYCPDEKILFSNDGFGQHMATSERFDDEYDVEIIIEEAKKYYANIVLPYSNQVKKAIESVKNFDIEMIAPSHGIIWRNNINEILKNYELWSSNTTKKKALIVYDTMWGSTEKIANVIMDSFDEKGYITRLLPLQMNHISDIMTEVVDAEYICVGSPTLNSNMMPNVSAFLTYLKGLAPKNRKSFAFGSYGWSPQGIERVGDELANAKFEVKDTIKVQYIPDNETLGKISSSIKEKI